MATGTDTIYSSVPTPLYDIHNDFLNQNYQVPNDGTFGMNTTEYFYTPSLNEVQIPLPHPNNISFSKPPQVGLAPTFPTNRVTYNGGLPPTFQPYNAVPHSQAQSSFTTVLSPTCGSSESTSLRGPLTPSSGPVTLHQKKKEKGNPGKRATRNATQSAKHQLLTGNPRQKRGPNKRPPGTSFSDLLVCSFRLLSDNKKRLLTSRNFSSPQDGLPHEVRTALEEEYKGCCDSINTKDKSIKQKHWFTNRHCRNLAKNCQEAVPNFVCPAFLAFNSKCRAK